MIKNGSLLPGMGEGRGNTFIKGNLYLAFRQSEGEWRVFLASAIFQLALAQNNPYGIFYSSIL